MNLQQLKDEWANVPEFHKAIHESFCDFVNADEKLKRHRDWVETNMWGFGERSFWWLWKIICDELPEHADVLEVGVFRAATLSVIGMLRSDISLTGVTPLNTAGDVWESDYRADIDKIFDLFNKVRPTIIQGYSQEERVIEMARLLSPYDVVYLDGDHSFDGTLADFNNYAPMVKVGGYLVVDDCNNDLNFPPQGFFTGIQTVTDAKLKWLETQTDFEFTASCVHISIFRRIK